jgi:hypothetical protein
MIRYDLTALTDAGQESAVGGELEVRDGSAVEAFQHRHGLQAAAAPHADARQLALVAGRHHCVHLVHGHRRHGGAVLQVEPLRALLLVHARSGRRAEEEQLALRRIHH